MKISSLYPIIYLIFATNFINTKLIWLNLLIIAQD